MATFQGQQPTASFQSASLYVGDLNPDLTEVPPLVCDSSGPIKCLCCALFWSVVQGILFELFNKVGPVASIRVCLDAVSWSTSLHMLYHSTN